MSYSASAGRVYCVKARLEKGVFKRRQKDPVFVEAWILYR